MTAIYQRGKPLNNEKVHFYTVKNRLGLDRLENALCLNGAYHIIWTRNPKKVTCPECLKLLKQRK